MHYKDKTPPTADEAAANTVIAATALGAGVQPEIVVAALGNEDPYQDDRESASGSKKKKRDG